MRYSARQDKGIDNKDETLAAEIRAVNGEWVVIITSRCPVCVSESNGWKDERSNKVQIVEILTVSLNAPCLDFLSGRGGSSPSSTLPHKAISIKDSLNVFLIPLPHYLYPLLFPTPLPHSTWHAPRPGIPSLLTPDPTLTWPLPIILALPDLISPVGTSARSSSPVLCPETVSCPSIPPLPRSLTKTMVLSCPPISTNPLITTHLTLLITSPCTLLKMTKWTSLSTPPMTFSPIPHPLSRSRSRPSLTNASVRTHPPRHLHMVLTLNQFILACSHMTRCPPSILRALVPMI